MHTGGVGRLGVGSLLLPPLLKINVRARPHLQVLRFALPAAWGATLGAYPAPSGVTVAFEGAPATGLLQKSYSPVSLPTAVYGFCARAICLLSFLRAPALFLYCERQNGRLIACRLPHILITSAPCARHLPQIRKPIPSHV